MRVSGQLPVVRRALGGICSAPAEPLWPQPREGLPSYGACSRWSAPLSVAPSAGGARVSRLRRCLLFACSAWCLDRPASRSCVLSFVLRLPLRCNRPLGRRTSRVTSSVLAPSLGDSRPPPQPTDSWGVPPLPRTRAKPQNVSPSGLHSVFGFDLLTCEILTHKRVAEPRGGPYLRLCVGSTTGHRSLVLPKSC